MIGKRQQRHAAPPDVLVREARQFGPKPFPQGSRGHDVGPDHLRGLPRIPQQTGRRTRIREEAARVKRGTQEKRVDRPHHDHSCLSVLRECPRARRGSVFARESGVVADIATEFLSVVGKVETLGAVATGPLAAIR